MNGFQAGNFDPEIFEDPNFGNIIGLNRGDGDNLEYHMINDTASQVNNQVMTFKTLRTDKVIQYHELD